MFSFVKKFMKLAVIVHPNNKRPRIEKDLFGQIHVYVKEPPLDGKANLAVIESLADYFHIAKSLIEFKSGHKSKIKIFELPD